MKRMISLLACMLTVLLLLPAQTDCNRLFEPIAETIKKADVFAFSEYFAETVTCNISGEEQSCSKDQARQIIRKFFAAEGDVRSFTIRHCSGKEQLKYAIGNLTTAAGAHFRLTMYARIDEGKAKISQLRIEKQ